MEKECDDFRWVSVCVWGRGIRKLVREGEKASGDSGVLGSRIDGSLMFLSWFYTDSYVNIVFTFEMSSDRPIRT